MKTGLILLLVVIIGITTLPTQADSLEEFGDIMQIVLPAGAIGTTFFMGDPNGEGRWDKEGTIQGAKIFGASWATIYAGKAAFGKLRPHTDSRNSWPSGHTMGAFSGAAIFYQRYGPYWGIPAYAIAGVVGYSRVDSDKHFADDVVAGASIPMLYGALFGSRHPNWEQPIAMVPRMYQGGGYGLSWIITPETLAAAMKDPIDTERDYKWRYTFSFGPAFLDKNIVQSPSGTGTEFDMRGFNRDDNPTTTSGAHLEYFFNRQHKMFFTLHPFEARDSATLSQNIQFGGKTFTSGSQINSSWLLYDTRLGYGYDFTANPESDWDFVLGGGLLYQNLRIILASTTQESKIRDETIFPYLSTTLERRIGPRLHLGGDLSGFYFGDDRVLDALLYLGWDVTDQWTWTFGYNYSHTKMDTSEIRNEAVYHIPHISVSYRW